MRLRYQAALAVLVANSIAHGQGPAMRRHSFSATIFASAIAKFHGVKEPNQGSARNVATAVIVAAPMIPAPQEPIKADVLPKTDGPPPINATVVKTTTQSDPKAPQKKAAEQTPLTKQADVPTTPKVTSTPVITTDPPQVVVPGTYTQQFSGQTFADVFVDIAQKGVSINYDDTIKELADPVKSPAVTINFVNEPFDVVAQRLAAILGGYSKKIGDNQYIISKATPDSPNYALFYESKVYTTKNQDAASIQAVLSPNYKNFIAVDPKMNRIGISAPKVLLDRIYADIVGADQPSRQVLIEAVVTEITVDDSLAFGFSWNTNNFSMGSDLSLTYSANGAADLIKMSAAITKNRARLRANPHLMTMSGRESTISVGQDTYYSLLSGSTIYPTSQIQLIHTGVVLKFTAIVGDGDMITMNLDPSVSDAVVTVSGNPTSNIRTVSNRLRVKSGETIEIAGLIQETGTRQVIRVPILGYIPIIGEIFTNRTNDKKKVETIFFITPKIVDGP